MDRLESRINFKIVNNLKRGYSFKSVPPGVKRILCTIGVFKDKLSIAVYGLSHQGKKVSLIDYFNIVSEDCSNNEDVVWLKLKDHIENKVYLSMCGFMRYKISASIISWAINPFTVNRFVDHCNNVGISIYKLRFCNQKIVKLNLLADSYHKFNANSFYYNELLTNVLRENDDSFIIPETLSDSDIKQFTHVHKVYNEDRYCKFTVSSVRSKKELWDLSIGVYVLIDILELKRCDSSRGEYLD